MSRTMTKYLFLLGTLISLCVHGLTYSQESSGTNALAWSPDGQILATASEEGPIYLWDVSGTLIRTLEGHEFGSLSIDWSPDGQRIVSGGREGLVKVWSISEGLLAQTGALKHEGDVLSVDWNPKTNQVASASMNEVFIWDSSTWQRIETLGTPFVSAVMWSPDGTRLAVGASVLYLFDAVTFDRDTEFVGHEGLVSSIAWSTDNVHLVSGDSTGNVYLWDANTHEVMLTFENIENGAVEEIAMSPNKPLIAGAGDDGAIRVWNTETGELLRTETFTSVMRSVDWSAQGNLLAFGGVTPRSGEQVITSETATSLGPVGFGIIEFEMSKSDDPVPME